MCTPIVIHQNEIFTNSTCIWANVNIQDLVYVPVDDKVTVPALFYGKCKRSKNFVKKPFNKKIFFLKKTKKKKINHLDALAGAGSTAKKPIFFVATRVWYKIFYIFLCMVQLIYTICAPSAYHMIDAYHLCTIQNFWFLKNSFLRMVPGIHTICIPSMYHTIYLYHLFTICIPSEYHLLDSYHLHTICV